MQLHLHTQQTADKLISELISLVHEEKDIMQDEIILTPEKQSSLYLKRRIVEERLVCSGIHFEPLSLYIEKLRKRYNFLHTQQDKDPWEQQELTWRILDCLYDESLRNHPELQDLFEWLGLTYDTADYEARLSTMPDGRLIDLHLLHELDFAQGIHDFISSVVSHLAQDLPFGSRWPIFECEEKGKTTYQGAELCISLPHLSYQYSRLVLHKLQEQERYYTLKEELKTLDTLELRAWCTRCCSLVFEHITPELVEEIEWRGTSNQTNKPVIFHDFSKKVGPQILITLDEILSDLVKRMKVEFKTVLANSKMQESWSLMFYHQFITEISPQISQEISELRMKKSRKLLWAQKTAVRFLEYARYAPQTLCDWAEGKALGVSALGFQADETLHKQFMWQYVLWNHLVVQERKKDFPALDPARFISELSSLEIQDLLPRRIHIYGYTSLSSSEKLCIQYLSTLCEVHIYLLAHTSKVESSALSYWDVNRRKLLDWINTEFSDLPQNISVNSLPYNAHSSFHACMGKRRQIEVLYDLVIQALGDDPTLRLEDIAVICPNTREFLPLCASIMNEHKPGAHPITTLNFWSAHTFEQSDLEVYRFIQALIELTQAYVPYSLIERLLNIEGVRAALKMKPKDLEAIFQMLRESKVSWAWDTKNPERQYIGVAPRGTWSYTLRQLVAGVCFIQLDQDRSSWSYTRNDGQVEELYYLGDLGDSYSEALARLISFLEELEAWCRKLVPYDNFLLCTHDLAGWASSFEYALSRWFKVANDAEAYAHRRIVRWLDMLQDENRADDISLEEWKRLCEQQFFYHTQQSRLMPAALSFWEPQDLCAVSFKRVFLLGFDDECFPRQLCLDADNMLLWEKDESCGLRVRRNHDNFYHPAYHERQQLFLVVCSAQEVTVIYANKSDHTGQELELPLVIQDLREAGRYNFSVYKHPLFSFEAAQHADDSEQIKPFYSFDPLSAQKYEAYHRAPRFTCESLYEFQEEDLRPEQACYDIAELVRCITAPVKYYCINKFKLYFQQDEEKNSDVLSSAITFDYKTRMRFIKDHIKEAREDNNLLFSCTDLQNLLMRQLCLSKTPLEQAGILAVSKVLLSLYRMAGRLSVHKGSWMKEDSFYMLDIPLRDARSKLRLIGKVDTVLGDIFAEFTAGGCIKDVHILRLAFNFVAYLAHQYLHDNKSVDELEVPFACLIYDFKLKTKVYPKLHAPSSDEDMQLLIAWLLRMVRLYELSQAIPLPLIHDEMYCAVNSSIKTEFRLWYDKSDSGLPNKDYFDFVYQRDTYRKFLVDQMLPEACLAYLFKGDEAYRAYLEQSYKPASFNEYGAYLVWEPLVRTGVIREFN